MKMPDRVVLWDLDSTLANTAHRQHMVPEIKKRLDGGPTWLDYSMACANDTPVDGAAALVRLLCGRILQFGVSGRNASARQLTADWLEKHDITLDGLYLRDDGDHTPNGKYKVRVIRQIQDSGLEVVLFVEDWKETADYIREKTGIPVLLVQGDYQVDGENM